MDSLIKQYEGCKLVAYPDPITGGEPYTIGWGSTKKADGTPFKLGEQITQATADALLTDYLIKNIVPIFKGIPYNLTMGQKAAIASLVYNVGAPSFLASKCYKAICKKDFAGIFKEWDFGVKQLKGLAKRRSHELYLFLKDI